MTRWRIRTAPQDGRPEVQTIEADSAEDALRLARIDSAQVLSVEVADATPLSYEPAGQPPPSAPRQLPPGSVRSPGGGDAVMTMVGGLFTGIALLFIIIGIGLLIGGAGVIGVVFTLFPMIHLSVGVGLLWNVWGTRALRKRLYQHGVAATATIDRVGPGNLRVNGRPRMEIGWTFFLNDQPFHGKRTGMNLRLGAVDEGDRIWVLYDPEDPTKSVEWPPL